MAELTIDMAYGTALYGAAKESGKTEVIRKEAAEVVDLFKREHDFYTFVNAPGISAAEKKEVLETVFGGKISEELLNFLCILIDKGRIMRFDKMVKVYETLADKEEGVSYGTVYSVVPLTDDRIMQLEEETSKLLKIKVKLSNEIDPKLIGGIKVLVEGKIIDASIRKKFDDLGSQINLS